MKSSRDKTNCETFAGARKVGLFTTGLGKNQTPIIVAARVQKFEFKFIWQLKNMI